MWSQATRVLVAGAVLIAAQISGAEPPPIDVAEDTVRRAYLEDTASARWRLADEAALLCRKLVRANPRDPRAYHLLADSLAMSDPTRPDHCRPVECAEAVEILRQGRAQDAFRLDERGFSFDLGIVLSRLGRFEEALLEYDRGARLETFDSPAWYGQNHYAEERRHSRAVLNGNAAESLMALGRLEEAIARYRRAEELSSPGDEEWELAEWGLGVSLDRDGQSDKAKEAVERALSVDPAMQRLHDERVFFEPPGDIDYYLAMGHEVAYRQLKAPLDRARAVAAWRRFVAHPGVQRPFLERARRHLVELAPAPSVTPPEVEVVNVTHVNNEPRLRADAEVVSFLRRSVGDLQLCLARAQAEKPGVAGSLNVVISISWTGEVESQVFNNPLDSPLLGACIQRVLALSRMRPLPTPHSGLRAADVFVAALRLSP